MNKIINWVKKDLDNSQDSPPITLSVILLFFVLIIRFIF